MSNKTIKPKQEKMIEQVIATMAVENMMLSRDCYKNLWHLVKRLVNRLLMRLPRNAKRRC